MTTTIYWISFFLYCLLAHRWICSIYTRIPTRTWSRWVSICASTTWASSGISWKYRHSAMKSITAAVAIRPFPTSSSTLRWGVRRSSTLSTWSSPAWASPVCRCSSSICQPIRARKCHCASPFFCRWPFSSCYWRRLSRRRRSRSLCSANTCSLQWYSWRCPSSWPS